MSIRKKFPPELLIIFVSGIWKAILIVFGTIPFNADEAVVALMARHILAGERPLFFYGQAYMGSLDAYFVAAGFSLFGEYIWVIRFIQAVIYIATLVSLYWLAKAAFSSPKIALVALILLLFPPVTLELYTTVSLGGYGETLLIGNMILLLVFWYRNHPHPIILLLWGFFVGLGIWVNGLTLVYTIPAAIALACLIFHQNPAPITARLKKFLCLFPGMWIGSLPWFIFAAENGLHNLLRELLGSAVAVESQSFFEILLNHLTNFFLFGITAAFGFRPPWEVRWLMLPLLPLALIFWLGVFAFLFKKTGSNKADNFTYRLLSGVLITFLAGFLFTPFGVDPSGRYFLPLTVVASLVAGAALFTLFAKRLGLAYLAIFLVLLFQIGGTIDCAFRAYPGLSTQFYEPARINQQSMPELITFLKENQINTGYTNYWVAYPLAFLSQEELIFIPALPYHTDLRYTARDDRYPPYRARLESSSRPAFITTRNPALDQHLVSFFTKHGISYRQTWIDEYHVFYKLSEKVTPGQLGFGK